MGRVEGIIFDVDGTLVDTSEFIFQAYEHSLELHGSPKRNREEIAALIGKKLEECYAFLAPDANQAALIATHRLFQSKNPHLVKPFAYADAVLENLNQQGRQLALFTSRRNVIPSLEATGVDHSVFEIIIDGAMVERGKPDPEGVHKILGHLGLDASSVIMVGDAAVDIIVGKRADLKSTVGISHGFGTLDELQTANPDFMIDSLDQLMDVIQRIEEDGS